MYTETALPRIGGQEMVIDALARCFAREGHDVRVLAPRPHGQACGDDARPYEVVRHAPFVSTRRFLGWYARGLARFYNRWPFDVLHCHSVYPTAYLASLVASRIPAPLIVTSHGGDVREGNARMRKPGVRERHSRGIAAADTLVAISRYTRDGYRRLAPQAGPIVDIPNGVDLATFVQPVERPGALDSAIMSGNFILSLGRMHPQKGGDVLIRAFASALRQLHQSRLQLVLAGGGPMRAQWEALAETEGVKDRCHFPGFVAGETKTWLLQNALATSVPTRHWEAFGLTVVESFAAGRPVVASDLPGLADLILPNQTGLLVPPDDSQALSAAIVKLASGSRFTDQLGQAARRSAEQYAWPCIAAKHLQLYEQLATKRASAA
ncbi:MAG: glycosyltransferase family 4 protein [Pirellulales bacterium]|nr:glycosyltransferase family 4 protein [Pirellulales bacterium]